MSPTGRTTVVGWTAFGGPYPTTPGALQPNYMGGQTDGVVTTLDLFLEGLRPTSPSEPGCRGPLMLNGTRMPVAGDGDFTLYCSGAPPHAQGQLRIRKLPLHGFASIPSGALTLETRGEIDEIAVVTDADGYVETPFPLTSCSPGQLFAFRYVFRNPASCPAPTGEGSCASNGLLVTVQ
jgi:hypothetical protein